MSRSNEKHLRVIAIAPSTRGFGYAVLKGRSLLIGVSKRSKETRTGKAS